MVAVKLYFLHFGIDSDIIAPIPILVTSSDVIVVILDDKSNTHDAA